MADADAMLIRKLNVAAWKAATLTRIGEKAFGTRPEISFRYLAEEMATGVFGGVSPAAHSLAAIRSPTRCSPVTERRRLPSAESSNWLGSQPPQGRLLVGVGSAMA